MLKYKTIKESGANLSRLLSHLKDKDVAFITAFRGGNSMKANIENNKKLALDIYNLGYSYIKIEGGYMEEVEDGEPVEVKEKSFAVIHTPKSKKDQDEFFELMLGLCKKYNQDSVLISLVDREEDHPKASYNSDGEIVYGPFNKINTQDVESFFTKIHNHKFVFEDFKESIEVNKPTSFSKASAFYGTKQSLLKLKF